MNMSWTRVAGTPVCSAGFSAGRGGMTIAAFWAGVRAEDIGDAPWALSAAPGAFSGMGWADLPGMMTLGGGAPAEGCGSSFLGGIS